MTPEELRGLAAWNASNDTPEVKAALEWAANEIERMSGILDDFVESQKHIKRLQDVLAGYAKWEADMLLDDEEMPEMDYPRWRQLLALRDQRNALSA